MNKIGRHIEHLIAQHNCVIVPGLGGFITSKEHASLRGNVLCAPMVQIRFNPLLSHHDGLLAEQYMREDNLNYDQALEAIRTDVSSIRTELDTKGCCPLGRIGTLKTVSGQHVSLYDTDSSFLPDNIGLRSITLTALTEKEEKTDNRHKETRLYFPQQIMRYAAIIVAVSLLSLLIPIPVSDTHHQASISFDSLKTVAEALAKADTALATDTAISIVAETSEENITEKNTQRTTPTKEREEESAPSTEKKTIKIDCQTKTSQPYQLIVASLPSKTRAQQYIEEQTTFKNTELSIIECDGRFRISAGGFATKTEAQTFSDSIRQLPGAQNAWILKN